MPKQPIAVELEAINREGEIQTVYGSGLAVHGYSVYMRSLEASGHATWVFDNDTVERAYELAKRLSLALAITLTVRVPTNLMLSKAPIPPADTTATCR